MNRSILILLSAIMLFASCSTVTRHNYIVLIDNSKSITPRLLDRYLEVIDETILPNLHQQDKLTVMLIDECSLSESERVFSLDLTAQNFSNNIDGLNNEKDSIKARLQRFLNNTAKFKLMQAIAEKRNERKNCGNYTDIINAIYVAHNLVERKKNYTSRMDKMLNSAQGDENFQYENCVIFFSDMINEDAEHKFDFRELNKCTSKDLTEKINYLKNHDGIPKLNNVHIFVYGATASVNADAAANEQVENIRIFWELYFQTAGATLDAYGYDTKNELQTYMQQ